MSQAKREGVVRYNTGGRAPGPRLQQRLCEIPKWRNVPDTLGRMRVSTIALLFLALCAAVAQKKPADVQILETKAVRETTKISVDGKVRVTGEKPLHGLVIIFDFRSTCLH